MKVETISIDKLIPYHNNPRKDQSIDKVASSINEYGFQQPIVVDKNMVIVAGHTRYRASKKLGLKQVPISVIDNLSEEQIYLRQKQRLIELQITDLMKTVTGI